MNSSEVGANEALEKAKSDIELQMIAAANAINKANEVWKQKFMSDMRDIGVIAILQGVPPHECREIMNRVITDLVARRVIEGIHTSFYEEIFEDVIRT